MPNEFVQADWNEQLEKDARRLISLALEEDLGIAPDSDQNLFSGDLTTYWIADPERQGSAAIDARQPGIAAGLGVVELVTEVAGADLSWEPSCKDGDFFEAGEKLGVITGSAQQLLTCERVILNLLGRLCGIATLTSKFVAKVSETEAKLYDTRKTTPGWRRLEKYAVLCGGGVNHRLGLCAAVMIKDNHLSLASEAGLTPAEAVRLAHTKNAERNEPVVIEVEVDTLNQLSKVLPESPDVVLLDNMSCEELRTAVTMRDEANSKAILEASGGVRLETIEAISLTGVDRISVGALTHSAIALDIGLDWITH